MGEVRGDIASLVFLAVPLFLPLTVLTVAVLVVASTRIGSALNASDSNVTVAVLGAEIVARWDRGRDPRRMLERPVDMEVAVSAAEPDAVTLEAVTLAAFSVSA